MDCDKVWRTLNYSNSLCIPLFIGTIILIIICTCVYTIVYAINTGSILLTILAIGIPFSLLFICAVRSFIKEYREL